MADNVAITAGVGTSIASDDISSVHYQRVKLSLGADGKAKDLQPCTIGTVAASTVDTTIVGTSAVLFGVSAWSTGSTAAVRVLIRDSTSGSTGNYLTAFWGSTGGAGGAGWDLSDFRWFGPQGLNCASGIRVVLPTTEPASVSVYYMTQ